MPSIENNQEEIKDELSRELELTLEIAKSHSPSPNNPVPSEVVQNLCNIIEAVFIHGLRDPFFLKGSKQAKYPEPNFWPFLSKYTSGSVISFINGIPLIKSEIGKSRAWIRHVLNESSLLGYIAILTVEKMALSLFYHDFAFLRDLYQVSFLKELIQVTNKLHIRAAINNGCLNLWTPSPLILAGLVRGTAVRIQAIEPVLPEPRCSSTGRAVSMPARPLLLSPIRQSGSYQPAVCCEMSPLTTRQSSANRTEKQPRLFLTSTPIQDNQYMSMSPKAMGPLLVSRRIRRQRSSKSGSSMCSCSSLRSESISTVLSQSVPNVTTMQHHQSSRKMANSFHKERSDSVFRRRNHSDASTSINDVECDLDMSFEKSEKILNDSVFDDDYTTTNSNCSNTSRSPVGHATSPDTGCEIQSNANSDEKNDANQAKSHTMAVDIPNNSSESGEYGSSRPLYEVLASMSFGIDSPRSSSSESDHIASPKDDVVISESSPSADDNIVRYEDDPLSFADCLINVLEIEKSKSSAGPDSEIKMTDNNFGSNTSWRKKSLLERFTRIPRQTGLDVQDHRCPICRSGIGPAFGISYGICGLDQMSYCEDCMATDIKYTIPARVINSWDWTPRDVSHRGKAFIDSNTGNAIFNINLMNPTLYSHVPALNTVKDIRIRLQSASSYILDCEDSNAEYFDNLFGSRQYLYKDIHQYSLTDLEDVRSGLLEVQLDTWLQSSIHHILACYLCSKKGFTCALCSKKDKIHPFNTDSTEKCIGCNAVSHKDCTKKGLPCPKCVLRARHEVYLQDS